ncbi:MAG TPA: SpoIID/LytB domain-containing protein [bacterium]|nr:SpoIID/LytB domain-containing protein [bacterium]
MRALTGAVVSLCLAGCCYYAPRATVKPLPTPAPAASVEPLVRVRLTAASPVVLSSSQGLTLGVGASLLSAAPNQSVQVACNEGHVLATGGTTPVMTAETLTVAPAAAGLLRVGDRSYRGRLLLYRSVDGDLAVVNVLGLEDYLLGVVPCEIGPINPRTLEAAKAQAAAARSFTMYRLGRRQGLGHDLFDSYLRDQEYRGIENETDLSREAVTETRGEVIEFRGEVCEALYSANCGGVTADGSQPYLRSVPDTPEHRRGCKAYCSGKPNSSWQVDIARESLDAVASRSSGKQSHVRSGRLETDRSGRVQYVDLVTDRGSLRLAGSDFRVAMGLKSVSFTMTFHSRSVAMAGRGWGHGSGMCQDGAIAMAEAGASYREILQQYYSGVTLKRRY